MLGIDTQMGKLLQYVSDWEIFGLKKITPITFRLVTLAILAIQLCI